jgi:hypothetical protein
LQRSQPAVRIHGHGRHRQSEQREADASAKRMLFGRTKGEKIREGLEKSADIRKLDGARLDRDDDKR